MGCLKHLILQGVSPLVRKRSSGHVCLAQLLPVNKYRPRLAVFGKSVSQVLHGKALNH